MGEFLATFESLDPFGAELTRLVEASIPHPDDRLDLATFDRPLEGLRFETR